MKRKPPLRWDKIIAFITVITIICFSVIIYQDFYGNNVRDTASDGGNKSDAVKQQVQGGTAAGGQQENTAGKIIVCIDAGHGGTDGGAEYKGKAEKDQALAVAQKVKYYLEAEGVQVVMTRTTDETMELEKRVAVCNKVHAAAMVSIHRNYSAAHTPVSGIEAWIHSSSPADAMKLANNILSETAKVSGLTNRGVKSGTMENTGQNYYVNSHSECASCILELGFMNNSADTPLVTTELDKTAKAVADGIIQYLKGAGYQL